MSEEKGRHRGTSSHDSIEGAGWDCRQTGSFVKLIPSDGRRRHFSWLDPRLLWQARRNDLIARFLSDPTNDERRRWVAAQLERAEVPDDLIIDRTDLNSARFLVLGDTGEGDASQFALVPPLLESGQDTHFMVICSDVIYPAGDVNEYLEKFYRPYKDYNKPVYALPGNHYWYDGLNGFMVHFCGAEPAECSPGRNWILRRLWRKAEKVTPEVLERCCGLRPELEEPLKQPGSYFAIDTGPLRIIGIDAGINGRLDREQGEWLRRVARNSPKPKILLTGKPIYVDNRHHYDEGGIEDGATRVDDIVRAAEHNFVAAIGGDIHNYQRYPVRVGDRTIQYIVSGGGGAYMSATHRIPRVDVGGVEEDDFRCYPLRGDSLSAYSKVVDRRFFLGLGSAYIAPDEAAVLMGKRLGIDPSRAGDRHKRPRRRKEVVARLPFLRTPRPRRGRRSLEPFFYPLLSEVFDWDPPPFFKSFLRLEATENKLTITCYGVTGCAEHEENPPVEDRVEIRFDRQSPRA
ncbi:MAG: metallophosphoesterase [Actinomycetota bacterium]|nr:metallophosphoesterase [Actinomycetota bacterium]